MGIYEVPTFLRGRFLPALALCPFLRWCSAACKLAHSPSSNGLQARGRQERAKEEHYWAEGTKSHAGRLQDDAENHRLAEVEAPAVAASAPHKAAQGPRGQARLRGEAPP